MADPRPLLERVRELAFALGGEEPGAYPDPHEAREVLAEAGERIAALEAELAAAREALRGVLELDGYRPRDGSVNPFWEAAILAEARAVLSPGGSAENG